MSINVSEQTYARKMSMAMPPGLPSRPPDADAEAEADKGPKKPISRSKSFAEVSKLVDEAPTQEEIVAATQGMNSEELSEKVQALQLQVNELMQDKAKLYSQIVQKDELITKQMT